MITDPFVVESLRKTFSYDTLKLIAGVELFFVSVLGICFYMMHNEKIRKSRRVKSVGWRRKTINKEWMEI